MEVVQQLAQIGAGLGFVGVGPEKECGVLAVLRRGPMERKIGEQRLQARRRERGHELAANRHAQAT